VDLENLIIYLVEQAAYLGIRIIAVAVKEFDIEKPMSWAKGCIIKFIHFMY
jgi:hypothetical protein